MEPTEDELKAAIAEISSATRLDWSGPRPTAMSPDAVLRAAPRDIAVQALSALSRDAGPAGRVWATQLLVDLAPEVGRFRLAELANDASPVEVNTCLVGYRTVAAWAQDALARLAPPASAPGWWSWLRGER